jgi:phosphoglycolate phosphatase
MLDINKYNTIIFDLDGTLVDSVPELALALNDALTTKGFSTVGESSVREWVGNGILKLLERALNQLDKNNHVNITLLHRQFLLSYDRLLGQKTELYPGVKSLLAGLHQQNKTLVLLTNKPIQFVPELLIKMGIAHLFARVLGGDSLAEKKPHPLPLLHIMETQNINSNECLMVGDSRSDIICAQQAGIDSAALLQGYNQGVDLATLKPTFVFDDIKTLAANMHL